jgi:NADH-quinone oxidoreductase subunit J
MTPQIAIFLVLAAVALAGAVSLIFQRHPIHSALSLIVVMVSIACLYLLQGAEFIAAVQIIVYGGAIMVLFIFVIMLLNAGEEEREDLSRLARFVGVPVGIVFLCETAYWIGHATSQMAQTSPESVSTHDLSTLLFREYAFPFEMTSFLILIALLGAMVLAKREDTE